MTILDILRLVWGASCCFEADFDAESVVGLTFRHAPRGFVTFRTEEQAQKALTLHGRQFEGGSLVVRLAHGKNQKGGHSDQLFSHAMRWGEGRERRGAEAK